jgi:hypothetical protein
VLLLGEHLSCHNIINFEDTKEVIINSKSYKETIQCPKENGGEKKRAIVDKTLHRKLKIE